MQTMWLVNSFEYHKLFYCLSYLKLAPFMVRTENYYTQCSPNKFERVVLFMHCLYQLSVQLSINLYYYLLWGWQTGKSDVRYAAAARPPPNPISCPPRVQIRARSTFNSLNDHRDEPKQKANANRHNALGFGSMMWWA